MGDERPKGGGGEAWDALVAKHGGHGPLASLVQGLRPFAESAAAAGGPLAGAAIGAERQLALNDGGEALEGFELTPRMVEMQRRIDAGEIGVSDAMEELRLPQGLPAKPDA